MRGSPDLNFLNSPLDTTLQTSCILTNILRCDQNRLMSKKLAFITAKISFLLTAASAHAQLISPGPGFVVPGTSGSGDVSKISTTIVNLLFYAATSLAIIYLIIGGIRWITSRGDKLAVESARKQIVAAIIGLVVVAGAFLILRVVFSVLNVTSPLEGTFELPHL